MRKNLALAALACALSGLSFPACAEGPASPMDCSAGPLARRFGGTDWLVYACADGRSLVIMSAASNPATPFYFMFTPREAGYGLVGEGTGAKDATAAAFEELSRLSPSGVAALLKEARGVAPR